MALNTGIVIGARSKEVKDEDDEDIVTRVCLATAKKGRRYRCECAKTRRNDGEYSYTGELGTGGIGSRWGLGWGGGGRGGKG